VFERRGSLILGHVVVSLALSLAVSEIRLLRAYSLKLFIKNCGQTAADRDMVTTDNLQEIVNTLSDGTIADPLRLTV